MTDKEKKDIYMGGYVDGLNYSEEFYGEEFQQWEPLLMDWWKDDSRSFDSMPRFELDDEEDSDEDDE